MTDLEKQYIYPATLEVRNVEEVVKTNINKFFIRDLDDINELKRKYRIVYDKMIGDGITTLNTVVYTEPKIVFTSSANDVDTHINTFLVKCISYILIDVINNYKIDNVVDVNEMLDKIEKQLIIVFNRNNIDDLYSQLKELINA